MTRTATVERITAETDVRVRLVVDGTGTAEVDTGIGMFDHLLTTFAHHGLFDLEVRTTGDLHVDEHHTVEDTALALGEAFDRALGDRARIRRFGDAAVPMDEAIARAVVDAGGRPYAVVDLAFETPSIGRLGTQMIPHLLEAFARTARFTLHLDARGRNDHHVAEAAFKALAVACRAALEPDPRRRGIPSTKGTT
ncbi:MAG TPA: imidazoleglycerol-phosphate dehydratase HisB [Actinobacteria bacterium]|nr:imidazoleglycerol-phosphate dehydratase HisB [Actinomycetota bacterium]